MKLISFHWYNYTCIYAQSYKYIYMCITRREQIDLNLKISKGKMLHGFEMNVSLSEMSQTRVVMVGYMCI